MHSALSTALVLALQSSAAFARPTAQSAATGCGDQTTTFVTYANDPGQEIVDGTPFTGGILCIGDGRTYLRLFRH